MTLVDNFCQIYMAAKVDMASAARLRPRLVELWMHMSNNDRRVVIDLLHGESPSPIEIMRE